MSIITREGISELLAQEVIVPIDYALADRLINRFGKAFLFICFLSKASREGHLCVQVNRECVLPDPQQMMLCDAELIFEGYQEIPKTLITSIEGELNQLPSTPLIQNGNLVYFQKNWLHENIFKKHLGRILRSEPEYQMESESLNHVLDDLWKGGMLLEEQFNAIRMSLLNTFTIIAGGPGTGKTYTAGMLLKTFWEALTDESKSRMNIVLAAPTGKAASNLQKSIQKACKGIKGFPQLQAQTLHSLLGRRKNTSLSFLRADFILVDECSMIDASIMSHLLSRVKSGARLIFLGDPHQLPPVESGALFADMNDALESNRVMLKQCLRSDLKGILEFASEVKEGNEEKALNLLKTAERELGVNYIASAEQSVFQLRKFFLNYAADRFPSPLIMNHSPSELIESFNRFRILTPIRRGPLGVDALNNLFLDYFKSKKEPGKCFVAPIMLINNDYRLQLFNGEVGVLVQPVEGEEYLFIQSSTGIRKIPGILIPRYEFAYALSVHKSQGSEFDEVLALFPEGSEVFGREVLYTAATRARKLLEIWGSTETLQQTIKRKVKRLSGNLVDVRVHAP
jgi:exodeoxyribonuclease V alpha subunit